MKQNVSLTLKTESLSTGIYFTVYSPVSRSICLWTAPSLNKSLFTLGLTDKALPSFQLTNWEYLFSAWEGEAFIGEEQIIIQKGEEAGGDRKSVV